MSRVRQFLRLLVLPNPIRNFRRSANPEGIVSGWALLGELVAMARAETNRKAPQDNEPVGSNVVALRTASIDPAIREAIRSSWRNCWLFLGVAALYPVTLIVVALVERQFPPLSSLVDCLVFGLLCGVGLLRQACGNWRLRRGASGSLWQFLRAGKGAWPRREWR